MAEETNKFFEEIDRPYNNFLERSNQAVDGTDSQSGGNTNITEDGSRETSNPSGGSGSIETNGSVETVPVKDGGAFNDVWITNFIRSKNWKPKKTGFNIDGQRGEAEFTNVFISGHVEATSGFFSGQIVAGYIDIPDTTTSSSFHVDTSGNSWWGSTTLANSLAKVESDGSGTFSGLTVLNTKYSTIFETTGRFYQANTGTGAIAFGQSGASIGPSADGIGSSSLRMIIGGGSSMTTNKLKFNTTIIAGSTLADSGSQFIGYGAVTVSSTGHTFTNSHIGFKVIMTATERTLYATNATGGLETATALTTFTGADSMDLIFIVNNDHTSVDYYYRKVTTTDIPSWTKVTHTTNIPSSDQGWIQFSSSNDNTSTANNLQIASLTVER